MVETKVLEKIYKVIDKGNPDIAPYKDAFSVIRNIGTQLNTTQVDMAHFLRGRVTDAMKTDKKRFKEELFALYKSILCYSAPDCTDDFILYMELDRPYEKQFYLPRRKQLRPITEDLDRLARGELEMLGVSLAPGVGKALANDTPILTRHGWKNHGDLVVGDEVIGMDGNFKKVVAVHPKCQLDCLIEFTNGEKIVCHENHEWMVYDKPLHKPDKIYIAETKRLEKRKLETGVERGHRGHRYILQLPHRDYVVGEEKELPLDPYTFGVWLGDGTNKNPTIACAKQDIAVIERIVSNGIPVRWQTEHKTTGVLYFGFGIRKNLQSMDMCHSRKTKPKHIPDCYLTASINQRLALLAGLLDTDGTLSGSKYTYSTVSKELRDSFVDLVSTFGWRCCVCTQAPKMSSSGIKGNHAVYAIGFTPDCQIPCTLERKQNKEPHPQRRIGFRSITRCKTQEGNCITVEGDGMYLAGKTMLPTHNTTLAEFFLCRIGGKNPELSILVGSHSNAFLRGMYGEILRMLDKDGEYKWHDIFPNLQVINTNALDMMIDLGESAKDGKRFMTYEFSSIGSGNAGKVRASNLLYCDDLVDGLETALSKERLDKLYNSYATDYRQRKLGNAKELMISTRWSLQDVLGRLETLYDGNDRAKFINCPAWDENEQSLFDYPIPAGLTTKFLHEQKEAMDDASFRALYLGQPVERSGLLYCEDELRRYFELPDREPDAILAVCDTKSTGSDFCVMPIAYQYGQDYYIEDVICDDSPPNVVDIRLEAKLLLHNVQMAQFESNAAGGKTAEKVQAGIKAQGGRTKITSKWTQSNKETRILVASPFVIEHFLFKDNSVIKEDREYRRFMSQMLSYTLKGKNSHDDVPDALSLLSQYVQGMNSKAEVIRSPFRR